MPESEDDNIRKLLLFNIPDEELEGLTNNEFFQLLFHPYDEKSPLRFRETIDDDTLDHVPLFKLMEDFLVLLQREKSIKLSGADELIPRKFVRELYDKRYLLDDYAGENTNKIMSETDAMFLFYGRAALRMAGIVRKVKGQLILTQKGQKLLTKGIRSDLFHIFMESYTQKINWTFDDFFTPVPVGQMGFGYILYLLIKFGDENRDIEFYGKKYLKAFPLTLNHFDDSFFPREIVFLNCLQVRSMERFCHWFGFVTFIQETDVEGNETFYIRKTPILEKVCYFE